MGSGHRRAPRIPLIVPDPSARLLVPIEHLPAAQQERIISLAPYVGGLRTHFSTEWPAPGVSQGRPGEFTRTYPFADCWPYHPVLVGEFSFTRLWMEMLESGELELAAYMAERDRWSRHLRDITIPQVRKVSQLCVVSGVTKHVDPTVARRGFSSAAREHRWGRPVDATHAHARQRTSAGHERSGNSEVA